MFPHDQIQVVLFGWNATELMLPSCHCNSIRWHMTSICPIIGHVNFDHLSKAGVSSDFSTVKVLFFLPL